MYEDEIPKELNVGEVYTGEQLKAYVSKYRGVVLYTNDTFNLLAHVKYEITEFKEGFQHMNQNFSVTSTASKLDIFFAKRVS